MWASLNLWKSCQAIERIKSHFDKLAAQSLKLSGRVSQERANLQSAQTVRQWSKPSSDQHEQRAAKNLVKTDRHKWKELGFEQPDQAEHHDYQRVRESSQWASRGSHQPLRRELTSEGFRLQCWPKRKSPTRPHVPPTQQYYARQWNNLVTEATFAISFLD